jgi:S1-C subfamily serine protease
MKRWFLALPAAALLAAPAWAAPQADDDASIEKQLADARRRLEDAARDVAELSVEAGGPGEAGAFRYYFPSPRRAMLGVNLGGAEPNGGGVRVEGVSPGGPAAEAGVREGDVIVAIDSEPVTTGRELVRAMEDIEPGQKVELGLERGGKPVKLSVEARRLDQAFYPAERVFPRINAMPAIAALPSVAAMPDVPDLHWLLDDWGDAEFVTMTPGLGRYFGTEKGVLVARAPTDDALGLEDGDVIVSIGGRTPENGRHAMRILRSYEPGESVELRVMRDRSAKTLSATVPERTADHPRWRRAVPPALPRPPAPPAPPAAT